MFVQSLVSKDNRPQKDVFGDDRTYKAKRGQLNDISLGMVSTKKLVFPNILLY